MFIVSFILMFNVVIAISEKKFGKLSFWFKVGELTKMIPWKMTQKQALVPQNSTYSILRTFSSPLDILG